MTDQSFDLDALDPRYTTILCDLWGVVHDGFRLLPGSAARLSRWARERRRVILITNAPRTAETVQAHLDQLGLARIERIEIEALVGHSRALAAASRRGKLDARRRNRFVRGCSTGEDIEWPIN